MKNSYLPPMACNVKSHILTVLLTIAGVLLIQSVVRLDRFQHEVKGFVRVDGRGRQLSWNEDKDQAHISRSDDSASSDVRRPNRGIAEYSSAFIERLKALTSRKAKSRDPELIQLIRDSIDPPSDRGRLKISHHMRETPQTVEVKKVLNKKEGGFFIECGGFDGERSSNTIYLEKELGWTGLLIEMDPYYYTQLLGKNRKSWSINACLSPYEHVIELPFRGATGGAGKIELKEQTGNKLNLVPCFPFESIMLALNQSHVDYFSLDVEGNELSILRTIPFSAIVIDMWSVEYVHGNSKNETLKFMLDKGYTLHKDIKLFKPEFTLYVDDFIFIRNDFKPVNNNATTV